MPTTIISRIDALHCEWNKARTAYYADPTEDNEIRMDDALRVFLTAKEAEVVSHGGNANHEHTGFFTRC